MGYIASSRPARELDRETLLEKPSKKVKKKRKKKIRNVKKRIAKNLNDSSKNYSGKNC